MLARLADRLILCPSTEPIDAEYGLRRVIQTSGRSIEAWVTRSNDSNEKADLLAIKFPGTAGRAERSGPHPFETVPDRSTEVWTINHAGYGGSTGPATLQNFATSCDAVWHHLAELHPEIPIVLVGNSLGCLSALYLAARKNASGIFLRNPVPLQQMIAKRVRYNWWNLGLARLIANAVPKEFDAVENAKQSGCPLLLIRSEMDRVAPAKFQRMIFENYAGQKAEFLIPGADHHDRVAESEIEDYRDTLRRWIARLQLDR